MDRTISIIIPFYNAQRTLKRCLESIAVQSFRDFEVILVNDGSTDESLKVCDFYLQKFNFLLFTQCNKGVSAARNLGIKKSTGKYLCFIDSDDYIEPDYLKNLYEQICVEQAELVITGYKKVLAGGQKMHEYIFQNESLSKGNLYKLFSELSIGIYGFPWAKLFLRDIVVDNDIHFEENISFSEDLLFLLDYLLYIKSVRISSNAGYLYCIANGSLSTRIFPFEKEYIGLQSFVERLERLSTVWKSLSYEEYLFYSRKSLKTFIDRIYLSIYKRGRKERVKILKMLGLECQGQVIRNYKASDPIRLLFRRMMSMHCYGMADCVMYLFVNLRKLKHLALL